MNSGQIGWLTASMKFICNECCEEYDFIIKPLTRVYASNILPYSQDCSICEKLIIDGAKKVGTAEPLCLFDNKKEAL